MEAKHKKIAIAILVAVVLLGLGLFFVLRQVFWSKHSCESTGEMPIIDVTKLSNVANNEKTAMARVAAYMRIWRNSEFALFTELELEQVHTTRISVDETVLELKFDCGKLIFKIRHYSNQTNQVSSGTFSQESSAGGIHCNINSFYYEDSESRRYSCGESISYDCTSNNPYDGRTVSLNLASFDFEVDGNPELIYKGIYSKLPSDKSCTNRRRSIQIK